RQRECVPRRRTQIGSEPYSMNPSIGTILPTRGGPKGRRVVIFWHNRLSCAASVCRHPVARLLVIMYSLDSQQVWCASQHCCHASICGGDCTFPNVSSTGGLQYHSSARGDCLL